MINLEKYAEALNTTVSILKSKSRKHEYVILRQVIWKHLVKEHTYKDIARAFNKDHSTVISGVRRIEGFIQIKDKATIEALKLLKNSG